MIVDGKRDPGQQQAAPDGGQPAGKLDGERRSFTTSPVLRSRGGPALLGAIGHPKDGCGWVDTDGLLTAVRP